MCELVNSSGIEKIIDKNSIVHDRNNAPNVNQDIYVRKRNNVEVCLKLRTNLRMKELRECI